MTEELDRIFQERPRNLATCFCGNTNEITITVKIAETKGDTGHLRSKSRTQSFCEAHGIGCWQTLVAELENET